MSDNERINPFESPRTASVPEPEIAPVMDSALAGLWRDGNKVVVGPGTLLPQRCVQCNCPASGYATPLAYHGQVSVEAHYCPRHYYANLAVPLGLVAVLVALAAVPWLNGWAADTAMQITILIAVVITPVAVTITSWLAPAFVARKRNDGTITIDCCGRAFVESLPTREELNRHLAPGQ